MPTQESFFPEVRGDPEGLLYSLRRSRVQFEAYALISILLNRAAWKDTTIAGVRVARGEFAIRRKDLCERMGLSLRTLRSAEAALEKLGEVTHRKSTEVAHGITVYRIVKYEHYARLGAQSDTQETGITDTEIQQSATEAAQRNGHQAAQDRTAHLPQPQQFTITTPPASDTEDSAISATEAAHSRARGTEELLEKKGVNKTRARAGDPGNGKEPTVPYDSDELRLPVQPEWDSQRVLEAITAAEKEHRRRIQIVAAQGIYNRIHTSPSATQLLGHQLTTEEAIASATNWLEFGSPLTPGALLKSHKTEDAPNWYICLLHAQRKRQMQSASPTSSRPLVQRSIRDIERERERQRQQEAQQ